MTFDELVAETCERLNLTSDEAKSRVGRELNSRYRRVTSRIGMETTRRSQVSKAATIGNRTITFTGAEKIIAIIDKTSGKDVVLAQVTMDDMHNLPIKKQPPRHYAISRMHRNSVDVYLDCTPTTAFILYADIHTDLSTLAGSQSPDFPESFHEILIFGAMGDEYRKMEKGSLAQSCELDFEKCLSDLRMWIAKTAYLDPYQGKSRATSCYPWTRGNG